MAMVRGPVRAMIIPPRGEGSRVSIPRGPDSLGAWVSGFISDAPCGSRQIRPGWQLPPAHKNRGPFFSARSSAPSDANAMPPKASCFQGSGTRRNVFSSSVRHSPVFRTGVQTEFVGEVAVVVDVDEVAARVAGARFHDA